MNFKKITALAIAFSCVTTIVPSTLSIGSTAVYAASKGEYLQDISLKTNKGSKISIYTNKNCSSKYKLDKLSDDDKIPTDLYAKVSSNVSKVNFRSISVDDGYTYKIYKSGDEIDTDDDVKVSNNTTFKIKIYDEDDSLQETYNLKIIKDSDDDDDEDDDYDDIYLDDLSLTNNNGKDVKFSFKKSTTSYDIDVANSVTYIKVCAEPEDDDYTVKINGSRVDDDDDWTKKVTLNEGKNEIPVRIKDDDDNERIYTLNITRASKTQDSTNANSGTTNNTTSTTTKPSPDQVAPIFSTAKLGWILQGNNWYFVQPDGRAATGWVYSNYKWYYMNTNGVMRTGWVQVPTNNKWYYFDGSGAMLSNTSVGGYKLGSDGAWIQ